MKMRSRQYNDWWGERGSAMVLAIFVLVLLTSVGVGLLFLSDGEKRMTQANLTAKKAFFLAEAGLEDGRTTLANGNTDEQLNNELVTASGANGRIDFDPATLEPVYDTNGNVTGFTGYGDDVPLRTMTTMGEGVYISFLTNDAIDIQNLGPVASSATDTNERVVVSGAAVGPERSMEVVQAIIEYKNIVPGLLPATITLLGPTPDFRGARSRQKEYIGNDCNVRNTKFMPVVGTVGAPAEVSAEQGITKNPMYFSGGMMDHAVFADLTDTSEPTVSSPIGPPWTDCQQLVQMVEDLRGVATVFCPAGKSQDCGLPPSTPGEIVFVEGDWVAGPDVQHQGMLVVTGQLEMDGNASWTGSILVIGKGEYVLKGNGNGSVSGGMVVADVAGPDNVYGTSDDCQGPDNGFDVALYDESGGGNGIIVYCTADLLASMPQPSYPVVGFLQR